MDLKLAEISVLVTGGGGFLGRHVVERLRAAGCPRVITPARAQCDLTRPDEVERIVVGEIAHFFRRSL